MSGRPSGCTHQDWPCCGCGEEPSQEEQHEQFEEMRDERDGTLDDEAAFEASGGDHEAPMTDWEADTPMGREYGDGFEQD